MTRGNNTATISSNRENEEGIIGTFLARSNIPPEFDARHCSTSSQRKCIRKDLMTATNPIQKKYMNRTENSYSTIGKTGKDILIKLSKIIIVRLYGF